MSAKEQQQQRYWLLPLTRDTLKISPVSYKTISQKDQKAIKTDTFFNCSSHAGRSAISLAINLA